MVVAVAAIAATAGVVPALAASPQYAVEVISAPSNLPPGGEGHILLQLTNIGDATATGETTPIVIADKLPPDLVATAATLEPENGVQIPCELGSIVRCEDKKELVAYGRTVLGDITVKVAEHPSTSPVNEVNVYGGGASGVVARRALTLSNAPASFGVEDLSVVPTNEDGSVDTQAGSHPFQLTTRFQVTDGLKLRPERANENGPQPAGLMKDLHFDLPPGLVGNAQAIPQCTSQEFDAVVAGLYNLCPADTAIGAATVYASRLGLGEPGYNLPLFNLVPARGEPARFGFVVLRVPVILDTAVRTGKDYGVVVNVNNISNTLSIFGSRVSFWGVPADPRHDSLRGWSCIYNQEFGNGAEVFGPCPASVRPKEIPFLTLPTSCTGPDGMRTIVESDSWEEPGAFHDNESLLEEGLSGPLGLGGCNQLPFDPSISVAPDGSTGSTPSGLTVGVHVPQEGALNPTGLSPADVKDTTVTLPAGIQISPAGADGLEACSQAQIGLEEHGDPSCPNASKIATAEIQTPLLPNPLTGEVYLAAQNANPFGSLVAMYIVAKDPVSGVLVKLAGQVTLDPVTGQLVSTFEKTPQLPFEELTLHFFGSARAPLTTPALCGTYTTTASIAPWSGNEPATPSSSFQITSGPNGAPCSDPQPFAPGFQSGSTNLQAGAFTPFTLTMSRPDADQTLSRIELQMPPGLLGMLSNVKLCTEPQASQGTCSEESLIGHTVVSAGLGNDPFTVTGGKVFITTGYKGAPYGLSILNPAKAGPFDLGTVVVRASIAVDPQTAALTIKSDPLPTIIDGIPLQIQHVNVTIDRERFTFNPTNCEKMQIGGTLSSTEGVTSRVATSFQVTNCATLGFKPKFSVSTSGKTSRQNGASLDVKMSYPPGSFGKQANIRSVKVSLPKQLPSRLTTLQKACPDTIYNVNPAGCPAASKVGTVTTTTPVLPVPLSGPVYFVSHGARRFPDLVVVLQGYGVTVSLDGETFISKKGITSTTFRTVPDVPFENFELKLPQGPFSALSNNGNLCKGTISMPTALNAQNGLVIHQSTKILVTGCPKTKKSAKKKK
ncbi:MAG TPA: hypothetical protein VK701_03945 [Solirubrobacteraceae bacterium]|nr:hypothetical protein [Solirubrobacteraceae bacterium]